jgi:uncharacterized repeat protein (TIGR03803 family)
MTSANVRCLGFALIGGCILLVASGATAYASSYGIVYSFQGGQDGANPIGVSLLADGKIIYGATTRGGGATCAEGMGCGTVFKLTIKGSKVVETVLHRFQGAPADGSLPEGGLTIVGSTLYGTTYTGGAGTGALCLPGTFGQPGCGTIFALPLTGGNYAWSYSLSGGADGAGPNGLTHWNHAFYATAASGGAAGYCPPDGCGTVLELSAAGVLIKTFPFLGANGAEPVANLTPIGPSLYSITCCGGTVAGQTSTFGTVYQVTKNLSGRVIYNFQNGDDGAGPVGGLLNVGGVLYGMTFYGGKGTNCAPGAAPGCGTLYSITNPGGAKPVHTVLYSFLGGTSSGAYPGGTLVNVNGTFFGVTGSDAPESACTADGCGTVFSWSPSAGYTLIHTFRNTTTDGGSPAAGLTLVDGKLYGTTEFGGSAGYGTVYSITP